MASRAVVAVYVSFSDAAAVSALRITATRDRAADGPVLLHSMCDGLYDRTSIVLEGSLGDSGLAAVAGDVLAAAIAAPPRAPRAPAGRRAPHPRLGVVDHVAVQLLGDVDEAGRTAAAACANDIARSAEALGVGVQRYGWASEDGVTLAELRRRAGYFRPGGDAIGHAACTVGASEPVLNYNLAFAVPEDAEGAERVRRWLARSVGRGCSERGGGLEGVESATLHHGEGEVEVACNLTAVGRGGAGPADVMRLCSELHRGAARPAGFCGDGGDGAKAPGRLFSRLRGGYVIGVMPSRAASRAGRIRRGEEEPLLQTPHGLAAAAATPPAR